MQDLTQIPLNLSMNNNVKTFTQLSALSERQYVSADKVWLCQN